MYGKNLFWVYDDRILYHFSVLLGHFAPRLVMVEGAFCGLFVWERWFFMVRKAVFLHVKSGLSQPKRYIFYKSSTTIFSVEFHNSLITSILQKPQNLAPFCEEKIFCAENRHSRATCMVNLTNCKQRGLSTLYEELPTGVSAKAEHAGSGPQKRWRHKPMKPSREPIITQKKA